MRIAKQFPTDADVVIKVITLITIAYLNNENLEQSIWVSLSEMRLNR